MLTAIALDDEIPALEVIEAFSGRSELLDLKACFNKTGEARRYLEENPVDLIFLDVNMPAMSGIEFAQIAPKGIIIIFTTSYAQYAVDSYNLNAVDYLLKPFSFERFQQAIEKAQILHEARLPAVEKEQAIVLKANYGYVKIWPKDIQYIEGLDNYLKIHIENQDLLVVRLTLKEMMEKLPADQFVRIHRSFIISLARVEAVRNKKVFIEEQEIPLGGKYEADFFKVFKKDGM